MGERVYYEPVERGLEIKLRESSTGCARSVPAPGTRARDPLFSLESHPPGLISRCRWIRAHEAGAPGKPRWPLHPLVVVVPGRKWQTGGPRWQHTRTSGPDRSEERCVGKECACTCRTRGSPEHTKKNTE